MKHWQYFGLAGIIIPLYEPSSMVALGIIVNMALFLTCLVLDK